jgi:pimeloyl-ACP methyl ester carboxylesterase
MLREGSGEPLVLLHGILNSEHVWRQTMPLLAGDHDVIALTAAGHRGGPRPTERPATIATLTDAAERQLDELDLGRVHLAGNSLGGWMAFELARRGRAKSVCGLSPAGFWPKDWVEQDRVFELLLNAVRDTRRGRRMLGSLSRSARFRRWAMRDVAVHGNRVSREDVLRGADDVIGCYIAEEFIVPGHRLEPLEASCPVTLAWAAHDVLFPLDVYRERAEVVVPGAEFVVLEDVGHVPMHDDPQLVAEVLRRTAAKDPSSSSSASLSSPGS